MYKLFFLGKWFDTSDLTLRFQGQLRLFRGPMGGWEVACDIIFLVGPLKFFVRPPITFYYYKTTFRDFFVNNPLMDVDNDD